MLKSVCSIWTIQKNGINLCEIISLQQNKEVNSPQWFPEFLLEVQVKEEMMLSKETKQLKGSLDFHSWNKNKM